MTVKKDIAMVQGWEGFQIMVVTVCSIDQSVVDCQYAVICQDGKFQHHLIYFCITVSANAEEPVFDFIQRGQHFLGCVVPGKIISGAVIEDITQNQQPICLFCTKCPRKSPMWVDAPSAVATM